MELMVSFLMHMEGTDTYLGFSEVLVRFNQKPLAFLPLKEKLTGENLD